MRSNCGWREECVTIDKAAAKYGFLGDSQMTGFRAPRQLFIRKIKRKSTARKLRKKRLWKKNMRKFVESQVMLMISCDRSRRWAGRTPPALPGRDVRRNVRRCGWVRLGVLRHILSVVSDAQSTPSTLPASSQVGRQKRSARYAGSWNP